MIDQEDPTAKLNSRAEWGLNSIPRLVVHQDLPEGQENSQQGQNGQSQNTGAQKFTSSVTRTPGKHKMTDEPTGVDSPSKKRKWSIVDHFKTSDHCGQKKVSVSERVQSFTKLAELNGNANVLNGTAAGATKSTNRQYIATMSTIKSDFTQPSLLNSNSSAAKPPAAVLKNFDLPTSSSRVQNKDPYK